MESAAVFPKALVISYDQVFPTVVSGGLIMIRRCRTGVFVLSLAVVAIAGQDAVLSAEKALLTAAPKTSVSDWNQYRGPNRDNLSVEKGLAEKWPDGGPERVASFQGLGEGYSTVSFVGDAIFTMGNIEGAEYVLALDRQSGNILWKTRNGSEYKDGTGNGPRGTPTVIDGKVFSLGGNGDLSCIQASDGSVVWQKNILTEFGGSNIVWGISESVLIDEERLICTPGGSDATVVALNPATGEVIWKCVAPEKPQAGYASPVVAEIGKVRQYIIFTSKGICGIRAEDGQFLWGQNASANPTANCATPLVSNRFIFSSSDYGTGAELVELTSNGQETAAKQVYFTKEMKNHHGGMVLLDGHVYGSSADILSCVDLKTGKTKWRQRSMKGSVVYADGKIIFRHENGPVTLLAANSRKYQELGRFEQPDRSDKPAWAHPVIADGRLYLRDMDKLLVYNLK